MGRKNIHVVILFMLSMFWITNSYAGAKSRKVKDTIPPLHSLTESDITYVNTGVIRQYIAINLHDLPQSVASYYLNYYSLEIHKTVKYPLCSNMLGDTSCTGKIALSSLLIYHSGDLLSISDSRGRVTPRQSADILINKIDTGLSQPHSPPNPWTRFKCGLKTPTETPPVAECNLSNRKDAKLGSACKVSQGSIIKNSVVGFYFPDKHSPGNFGLSCTGIPIAESWVITAAHCVNFSTKEGEHSKFYVPSSREFLLAGEAKLPLEIKGTTVAEVPNAIVIESQYVLTVAGNNEQCNMSCIYADFALLKVKNHKFTTIVPLADALPESQSKVWRIGYGAHEENGVVGVIRDGDLFYRNEYFYGKSLYAGILRSVGSWPEEKDNYRAWKFTGNGDSGGPLFIYKNNRPYLLSTLSGGIEFLLPNIICGALPGEKVPGTIVEGTSIPYWKPTIESLMNGTLESSAYRVG